MNEDVITVANGKWPGLLVDLGVSEQAVSGKHSPCPLCGGKDRFRMVEKHDKGWWICNQCGSGDGMDLALRYTGMDFASLADKVRGMAAYVTSASPPTRRPKKEADKMRRTYVRLWKAAKEQSKELLEEYMSYRCIDDWESADLQIHNQLDYYDDDNKLVGQLPCMLARVVTADGRLAGLHRTYLHKHKDGSFTTKKKLTPMVQTMSGGAIRLYGTEGRSHMCVAEGIESALSLRSMLNGTPAWAAISASNMEKMAIPEHVEHVYIGGDNDANFTGQKAAYALANRLSVQGKKRCVVRCDWDGNDANDELRNREG